MAKIEQHDIDIFVRLGFRVLRGRILKAARYGIWSYHHGDNLVNRGGPAGFWEAMESWPETGTTLQILSEDLDAGLVLYRSWSCTNSRSIKLNNNARYWTSASFLPRMVERLGSIGEEKFFEELKQKNLDPVFYSARLYSKPPNAKLLALILRKAVENVKRKATAAFYFQQWCLLIDWHPELATSMRRFKPIVPPRDRFWADPFVLFKNDKYHIYLEEKLYRKSSGHIALMVLDKAGKHSSPKPIIEEPHHLSYPFLFEYEKTLYLTAEAREARTVPLYRCVEFPDKWAFHGNLFEDIAAVDPTLVFHQGKWFLFIGVAENEGGSTWDELFLYVADNPIRGPWKPHPMNPIVSDVRSARPGGAILAKDGQLFRPSQNCSHYYGYGLKLNRILSLSEQEYAEATTTEIRPDWRRDVLGVHTLTQAGNLTVADALFRRPRYW